MALAQRVTFAPLVEEPSAGIAGQRLAREFGGRDSRAADWPLGCVAVPKDPCRRGVEVQTKEIGQVAMIAQPVSFQSTLDLLIAVLTFTPIGVLVVGRLRQYACARTIGDHRPAIRTRGVGFSLDDDPPWKCPRPSLILKRCEQPLRLARSFVLLDRFGQQGVALAFEHGIEP